MNRQVLIDGELLDVISVQAAYLGNVTLFVGLEGVPFAAHTVPTRWWVDRDSRGVRTGDHMYRHPEVSHG